MNIQLERDASGINSYKQPSNVVQGCGFSSELNMYCNGKNVPCESKIINDVITSSVVR